MVRDIIIHEGSSRRRGGLIPGLLSLLIPGSGQLVAGRPFSGLCQFVGACLLWFVLLGWIVHIWSAYDATKA